VGSRFIGSDAVEEGPAARPQGHTATAVRQATVLDIDLLGPLFDGYRRFYRQPSEPGRIRRFLLDRFEHNQSVIFVAEQNGTAVGFTQLYPSFSSAVLARIYILNDLFVDAAARRSGASTALLGAAADFARRVGALPFGALHGADQHGRPVALREVGLDAEHRILHLSTRAMSRASTDVTL
jgi:GNAT superfamily N-acetyltransferase